MPFASSLPELIEQKKNIDMHMVRALGLPNWHGDFLVFTVNGLALYRPC